VPVYRREVRQVGTALKFQPVERDVRSQGDIERVFASLSRSAVDGVFIASLNLRVKFHALILRRASERHLPVLGHRKEWVEQGALFSYAENIREVGRAAAAPSLPQRADQVIEQAIRPRAIRPGRPRT